MRSRAAVWLLAGTLSGFALVGSFGDESPSTSGPITLGGGGGGGVSIYPPKAKGKWYGTFGGFRLCLTKPGVATLTKVEFSGPRDVGDEVRAVVRRVSRTAVADGATVVYSWIGTPEKEFGSLQGQSIESVAGAQVTDVCVSPPDETEGFSELMTVLAADVDGNAIDGVKLHYTVKSKPYVTTLGWKYFVCDRARVNEACRRPAD